MYLRETTQKVGGGKTITHLQLAESVWDTDKKRSVAKIIANLGRQDDPATKERLARLAKSILRKCPEEAAMLGDRPSWRLLQAQSYGDVYALDALWRQTGIADVIQRQVKDRRHGFEVERALFAMVANRACAPSSKLYCYEQWLSEDVRIPGASELKLHQLYRAMDVLQDYREEIERAIFFQVADLFSLDVSLIFYDTTSLSFSIDEEDDVPDGDSGEGVDDQIAWRCRGYSKDGRGDLPQLVVGLAVTRDGIPVRHWVFPGNTVDVTTVQKIRDDLRDWQLSRCVFVGDAGMVSEENLANLAKDNGQYLVCTPVRKKDPLRSLLLDRAGTFTKVAAQLEVKEVVLDQGGERQRYVVCFNPQEETRQRAHRAQVLHELEAELAALRHSAAGAHSKRSCALLSSGRYGKYLSADANGHPVLDRAKVEAAQDQDGLFVVRTNNHNLDAAEVAQGYKQLQRAEEAFRTMKSGLRLRPVFHYVPHRIKAHIHVTVLALLLERIAERACGATWRTIRDDLRSIKLAQLQSPDGIVWQISDPLPKARNRLSALKIPPPPPILSLC